VLAVLKGGRIEEGRRFLSEWGEKAEKAGSPPREVANLVMKLNDGFRVVAFSGNQASIRDPKTGKTFTRYRPFL